MHLGLAFTFGESSPWVQGALLAATVLSVYGLWRDRRHGAVAGSAMLRIATLLVLAGIVTRVQVTMERPPDRRARLAVLFDTSASMTLPDAPDAGDPLRPRYERVRATWTAETVRALSRAGIDLEVLTFDEELGRHTGDAPTPYATAPDGSGSDLLGALSAMRDRVDASHIGGIVVVSDGRVAGEDATAALVDTARTLGVPVSTVAAGAPYARDVWIASVRAPPFAFAENVVDIDVDVAALGYPGRAFEVRLYQGDEILERRTVVPPTDGGYGRVRFDVASDRVGSFAYTVEVEGPADQATRANDRRTFVIEVLRDKVRILHVAGRPDWDVRALRLLLRRDPNVELLSYYILRDLDDILRDPTPADELSLIPFPTDELFSEELGSFDLVVLQNFDYGRHQVGRYLPDIARYVEEGGGLVLIGGDLGLGQPGQADASFAKVLPVDVRRAAPFERRSVEIRITPEGRTHPVTAGLLDASGTLPNLGPLTDRNRVRLAPHAAAIGTRVLLEGAGTPLLLTAEPGKGRVVVLATASAWRLGFGPDLAFVGGMRPYDVLWLGAIRWLLRDEASDRLGVETDRPRYDVGDPVRVMVTTLGPDYAPEAGVAVRGTVRRAHGATDEAPEATFELTTGPSGTARTEIGGLPVGAHVVEVQRDGTGAEDTEDTARHVFLVDPPRRELSDVDAREGTRFLAALAEATGGAFVDLGAGDDLPRTFPLRPRRAEGRAARRTVSLWDHPLLVLLALGLAVADVHLRRRRGLA